MTNRLFENTAMHRFEVDLGDGVAAAYYRMEENRFVLFHTEVPFEHSGQGVGSRLARAVFEELRARHATAVLRCPFLAHYFSRHPEYSDVVKG